MKFKQMMLAAAACSAIASPHAQQGNLSDDTLKLGVLTDMSGVYADFGGPGAVLAARMAVEDFGGKMFGKNIEVVSADHQNKADVAKNITQQWFDRDKVDATFENLNSAVALAVSALGAEKNRITAITGAATSRLTNEDCRPATSVHWVYDTISLANVVGKAVVKAGGADWYFLTADYAFGHSLEKDTSEVVKANGGKVVGAVRHPLNASDFSSFLLQAQASNAKVVGLANAGGDTINSIKAAAEFGITQKQNLAAMLMMVTDVHALGLKTAQGLYLTEGWYWDMNEENRAFAKRFAARHNGKMPNMNQVGVYSVVSHYLKAVQKAGTDDTAPVMKQMREMPVNDVFAKNGKLREDGRMVHDMHLFLVKKPTESKGLWDYYHHEGTVKGDEAFLPLAQSKCPLLKKG